MRELRGGRGPRRRDEGEAAHVRFKEEVAPLPASPTSDEVEDVWRPDDRGDGRRVAGRSPGGGGQMAGDEEANKSKAWRSQHQPTDAFLGETKVRHGTFRLTQIRTHALGSF